MGVKSRAGAVGARRAPQSISGSGVSSGAVTLAFMFVLPIVLYMLLYGGVAEDDKLWRLLATGVGGAVVGLVWVLRRQGYEWMSLPVLYLALLWAFHLSLPFCCGISPALWDTVPPYMFSWAQERSWYQAIIYSALCASFFVIGCGFAGLRRATRRLNEEQTEQGKRLFVLGIATAGLGAGLLVQKGLHSGGIMVFFRSYTTLFDDIFSGNYAWGVLLVSFGLLFAAAGARRRLLWIPIVLQIMVSAALMLIGARNGALLSPAAMLLVLARRGMRFKLVPMALVVLVMMWAVAIVKVGREEGIFGSRIDPLAVSPLDTVLELGGSLQTASLAFQWIEGGDDYQLGGGYWLPFERIMGRMFSGLRKELEGDPRAMSIVLTSRESGLGGSAVGESFYNFGVFGCIIFFLPLGYVLGKLDRRATSPLMIALLAVVSIAMFWDVRDFFLSVPSRVAAGMIPLLILKFWPGGSEWDAGVRPRRAAETRHDG